MKMFKAQYVEIYCYKIHEKIKNISQTKND